MKKKIYVIEIISNKELIINDYNVENIKESKFGTQQKPIFKANLIDNPKGEKSLHLVGKYNELYYLGYKYIYIGDNKEKGIQLLLDSLERLKASYNEQINDIDRIHNELLKNK